MDKEFKCVCKKKNDKEPCCLTELKPKLEVRMKTEFVCGQPLTIITVVSLKQKNPQSLKQEYEETELYRKGFLDFTDKALAAYEIIVELIEKMK